jgi:LmbE family N-acetylglucosaminyl deacetylase
MIEFAFPAKCRVLCLGAHSDDIEIGCGGTLLRLARECPDLELMWVVFSAEGSRKREAKASAKSFLGSAVQIRIRVESFRASYFPFQAEEIKGVFESLKPFQPDVVFTHYREDRHQDHRVVSDLTWNTFRNHLILEYEIPKYDGDLGQPNAFVALHPEQVEHKIKTLLEVYSSQTSRPWFDAEMLRGILRLRGVECRADYAEAFHVRKLRIGV